MLEDHCQWTYLKNLKKKTLNVSGYYVHTSVGKALGDW
jgi:hypothetical protein